ncbi:MAG: hypothetical protein ACK5B9_11860 [Flavobacteriia bacterium]|jgi:hypothetical protein
MKILISVFTLLLLVFSSNAQSYKSKKKKKDFFGTQKFDNRSVGNFGMYVAAGPSFSKASDNKLQVENKIYVDPIGNLYNYEINQKGEIGGNVSAGAIYFNPKSGWFSFGRIVDYFELGVGFNYYRGTETTTLTDAANRDIPQLIGKGEYKAGILSGRFGIHKIIQIPKTKMFLDNGLAYHADFMLLKGNANYDNFITEFSHYTPNLTHQVNYSLGLGFQLKRGSYLIPGVYVPVFSFKEMAKQSVSWFDSRYYPINVQLKWIYRFSKPKSKTNCTTPDKGPMPPPPAEGGNK